MARRVLFLVHCHPALRVGGAQQAAYELFLAMRDLPGWEPYFLAAEDVSLVQAPQGTRIAPFCAERDQMLLGVDRNGYDSFQGRPKSRHATSAALIGLLADLEPDVVHVQHTNSIGHEVLRLIRTHAPRTPLLFTLHEFELICANSGQLARVPDGSPCTTPSPLRCAECFPAIGETPFLLRELSIRSHLEAVDLLIAPSRQLLEKFVAWGIPRRKLVYLEYGRTGAPACPPRPLPPGARRGRFAFFGRLTPFKGLLPLLEAMKRAEGRPGLEDLHLTIHAAEAASRHPDYHPRLAQALDQAGPNVTVAGPYAPQEQAARMAEADWVVVPSTWWENSPLVIQEAFMHGRPVLCSDLGGMAEKVRDGIDGIHFRTGDPVSLLAAMERAVATPGLWESLRAAIEPVFTAREAAQRHLELYEALSAGGPLPWSGTGGRDFDHDPTAPTARRG